MTAEDFDDDTSADVWPENWPSWRLFWEFRGQWRTSPGGVIALDYTPLFLRMERLRVDGRALSDDEWQHLYDDVRTCEAAALEAMND